ncbi:endoribonuclease Dicer-like [Daphnia pulicaria]|uniref:endoribonuclease Dicer-like n=1 Tax=Daphnia pulicaria TaxID=35523 RepID=UPI001EEABA98|nr:endoribonuclease Dicer-like [Daphnia pulicaria]XP_046636604.1 endoribonuclease Dicer-like [Daphnia pulicaria]
MEALEAAVANIHLDEDDGVFSPRDYQIELFQAALDENIIVYLPTGSGKTYIAALLIKEKSHEVTKSLSAGGKRTVFLVPTIVLAIQQAAYLRKHTLLKVKEFYGSMGVDMWGRNKWETEFESNHVLVMTAQIFVDILNHAFFSPYQLNLLVFDECHSAVKDAPMKQVLTKLRSCDVARRPKILGLTAALFRKRCKPREVRGVIKQLSESMGCIVRIPSDVQTVYRSSTKPCEVIFQYDDVNIGQNPVSQELSKLIETLLASCTLSSWIQDFLKLSQNYSGSGLNNTFGGKKSDKIEVLCDALKDIGFLLENFGPYGAYHCAQLYIPILMGAKSRSQSADFNKVINICHKIQDVCAPVFAKYSAKERLVLFVHPNVIRLLDIIQNFDHKRCRPGEKAFKMCGIIFVERRSVASVLYHFLKDIRQHDENLEFVKPLFTMGQAAGSTSSLRESQILNMNQKDIMRDFRSGKCNLLVATSVLEEGVDIPECNLIVRFDKIRTYCDYVQTKGRARSKKAFFCMLVSSSDSKKFLEDMAQFHSIEQQLVATGNFEDDKDAILDNLFSQIIEPYTPYGNQGPRVTLQSSISLVNRYCSQLVSYGASVLVPRWSIKEVDESKADPLLLKKMKELMKQLPVVKPLSTKEPAEKIALFQCRLLLPKSSPLQGEVVGDPMLTKRLAKRAAALRACERLHQLKELDDLHLLPVSHRKR